MKKIFTLIAVLMSVVAQAQQIEDITSRFNYTWNGAETITNNADGSITFAAKQWGGLAAWFGDEVDFSVYSELVVDFAESTPVATQLVAGDIKQWGAAGISELRLSFEGQTTAGIQQLALQAAEDATLQIKRIYLVKAGTTPISVYDTETIWEGNTAFGNWAEGFNIAAEKFANAKEGDVIEFVYTTDAENATYWQFKTIFSGTENTLTSNAPDLNDWGCATVEKTSTSYKITLNGADIDQLKEKGMYVNGYYCIVTKVNLLQAVTWTVAGGSKLMGSDWNTADTNNDLTTTDGVNYTLVKEDVVLEKGVTYEYKVAKNHAWDEAYPAQNATLTVAETGKYTVTFTFNAETKAVSADAVKTGEAEIGEKVYSVIGTINGNWDVDTDMTKGDDGLYTAVFNNVSAGSYEFKVRVDHDWSEAYPSSNYSVTVASTSTVTVTFNADTKAVNATVGSATGIATAKIVNLRQAVRYNMAGQQVTEAYKGVVIVNGKKMIQK